MKISLLILCCMIPFLFLSSGCADKEASAETKREEAKLEKKDLRDVVTLLGLLEPKNQIEIRSEVSGAVTKIFVQEGASLKIGTPILLIDPRPYENEKEKLTLQRKKLELEYAIQYREWNKDSLLDVQGAVSSRQVQDQRDQLALKRLRLDEIDIDIKNVNEKLEKTTLTSPINGTLLSLNTKVGEIVVSATTGYSAGSTIGILANTDSMQVTCYVNEVDYQSIDINTPVNIMLASNQDISAKGRIALISKFAKPLEGKPTRNFEVRVDVYQLPKQMSPGINVTVEFVVLDKKGVMALPCSFVQQKGTDQGVVTVISQSGKEEERKVKTGATDYKSIEIIEGLKPEESVVEF